MMEQPSPRQTAYLVFLLIFVLGALCTLNVAGQLDNLQTGAALIVLATAGLVAALAWRVFARIGSDFDGSVASIEPMVCARVAAWIRLLAAILVALMTFIACTLGRGWLHGKAFEWPGSGNLLFAGLFLWMCATVAVRGRPPLAIQRLLLPGRPQEPRP